MPDNNGLHRTCVCRQQSAECVGDFADSQTLDDVARSLRLLVMTGAASTVRNLRLV